MPTSCSSAARVETALVVLAHAEMLGERHRKAGDEQAMAIGVGVMASRRSVSHSRSEECLMALQDLAFGCDDVAEFQRLTRRKLSKILTITACAALDATVQQPCRGRSSS